MEPNHNNYGPSAELPQPQEKAELTSSSQPASAKPETRGMQMPSLSQGVPGQPQAALPARPGPQPMSTVNNSAQPVSNQSHTAGLIADDNDLIEKEWVTKAKAIVAQTKDDPYNQNRAMNGAKADYLKKRYNKDLKVSEN